MSCGVYVGCGLYDRRSTPSYEVISSSCGVHSFYCGSSTPPIQRSSRNENLEKEIDSVPSVRAVYVYDVDVESRIASCLVDNFKDGRHRYTKQEVAFDNLRKFVKKGEFDAYELKGFRIKKDGEFKIKTKELKASKDMLAKKVESFESHFNHMKDIKKELKAEREVNENEEGMER